MRNTTPLSTGTHGGGQHGGVIPPPGGGGGIPAASAWLKLANATVKKRMNTVFFMAMKFERKYRYFFEKQLPCLLIIVIFVVLFHIEYQEKQRVN